MKSILIVLLLALVFAVSCQENLVNTQYGLVDGVVYDDSRAFLGIPYAAPPTGNLRLGLPQPPASWSEPLWAKAYQAGCPQTCQLPPLVCPVNVSEDCLTLNIWTPRLDQITGPLPVMVFIPGGRFEQGASGTVLYNSEYLVNTSKVISVSINYRLGALGFLVAETSSGYQANLGILDQRMALQFVQDNIANFGGDPTRVTLFGQSAGATSTGIHLTSPASWNYFSQAIMESFPLGLTLPDFDLSKKLSQRFSEDLGCGSDLSNLISCIQTKSIEDILAAQVKSENVVSPVNPLFIFMPWQPTVDGNVVQNSVLTAVYNGIYKKVPTIWGTVEQEGLMFVVQVWPDGLPAAEYEVIIDDIFGSYAKGVLQNYPPQFGPGNGTLTEMSHLATQYLFICPNLNMSQTMFNAFGANSDFYLYRYDHVMSFYEAWGPNYTFCYDAVCHGAELPFVFHSADKIVPPFNYTAEELVLTAQMSNYWGNFANTGNPNNGPNPVGVQWPQYTEPSGYQNIVLETPQITTESLEYNNICQFWNTVGYEIQ